LNKQQRQLLASLEARVRLFDEEGIVDAVLDPIALVEAERLWSGMRLSEGVELRVLQILALIRWHRYELLGDNAEQDDLSSAIWFFSHIRPVDPSFLPERIRDAFERTPNPDPPIPVDRPLDLYRQAMELETEYELTGELTSAEQSISLIEEALALTATDHPNSAVFLLTLSHVFLLRYIHSNAVHDLDQSIEASRKGALLADSEHEVFGLHTENLEFCLRTRFGRTGQLMDLEEAILAGKRAVEASVACGDPTKGRRLAHLADAYELRFRYCRDSADLDKAVELYTSACQAYAEDFDKRTNLLSFAQAHDAVQKSSPQDSIPPEYLASLGRALLHKFRASGDLSDLNDSVNHLRRAAARSAHDPGGANYSDDLAVALWERSQRGGGLADIEEGLSVVGSALADESSANSERLDHLRIKADLFRCRFMWTGHLSDIDEAATAIRRALGSALPGNQQRHHLLDLLARVLRERYLRTGVISDVDDAVDAIREAIMESCPGTNEHANYLSNLATVLAARFTATAVIGDLNEAIEAARLAVDWFTEHGLAAPGPLSTLGNVLETRWRWTGELVDLDEAVAISRSAVSSADAHNPDHALYLSMLGVKLAALASATGINLYLDEAVSIIGQALLEAPLNQSTRAIWLCNLGNALQRRFNIEGAITDLDAAVAAYQEAVDILPLDHPMRLINLNNLGSVLLLRHEQSGSRGDLNRAIEAIESCLLAYSAHDQNSRLALTNHGKALLARYQLTGQQIDLIKSVEAGRAAVADTPADHPYRASALLSLGASLGTLCDLSSCDVDLDELLGCWREVVALPNVGSETCVRVADAWGRVAVAAGRREEAVKGFQEAVKSLSRSIWMGLDGPVREDRLANAGGMVNAAAASAIEAGQLTLAVELLEQGRSMLWNQALQTRTDLSRLSECEPRLAQDIAEAAADLERTNDSQDYSKPDGADGFFDRATESIRMSHRRAVERWERLVARVRELPGWEQFLLPVPFAQLRNAAVEGPVVIVNVSGYRCDALIVTTNDLELVTLPEMTFTETRDRCNAMLKALGETSHRSLIALNTTNEVVYSVLEWLGRVAVGPILDALARKGYGLGGTEPTDRIWWCPTGPAADLPFHAAIHPNGSCALDHVVSSYTSTLQALYRSRAIRTYTHGDVPPVLIVGMPTTDSKPPLDNVIAELQTIEKYVSVRTKLLPPDATVDRVLVEMTVHSLLHLSCHGNSEGLLLPPGISVQALIEGSASLLSSSARLHKGAKLLPAAFHLVDGPLSIPRIAALNISADLAYLSACSTATGTGRLADEAIHLAGSMQFAGFRQVIATLWWTYDSLAEPFADHVYSRITCDGKFVLGQAPFALNQASRKFREAYPRQPALWAAYIHVGA
jgi:hypothetical protein